MYERILIPLDGSKTGEAALSHVERLFSKLSSEIKTEIVLLQVVSPSYYPPILGAGVAAVQYTAKEMETIKKKAMDYLNKVGENLGKRGTMVTAKVRVGDAYEEIIKVADEIKADLIAMSTHERSGLSRWAFGSVTDKVLLHGGDIPILAIRPSRD